MNLTASMATKNYLNLTNGFSLRYGRTISTTMPVFGAGLSPAPDEQAYPVATEIGLAVVIPIVTAPPHV